MIGSRLGEVFEKLLKVTSERRELLVSGIEACRAAFAQRERGPVGGRDRGGRFGLMEE
jgi:hypothetical protein